MKLTVEPNLRALLDDTALDRLAARGIRYLSVPVAFFDLPDAQIAERNRAFRARNLTLDTCHTPYGGGNHTHSCCSEDETIRLATVEMWRHYLRRYALVGLRAVPMHTGGCMREDVPQRLRDNLLRTLDALVPLARDTNVILALENTFYDNPPPFVGMGEKRLEDHRWLNDHCTLLRRFVDAYGDRHVRVCMDVGHANILGHLVVEDYAALRGAVALFHLHDNDGLRDQHYAPGLGNVPWHALASLLRRDAYDLPLYLEVDRDPDPAKMARIGDADLCCEFFDAARAALGECPKWVASEANRW